MYYIVLYFKKLCTILVLYFGKSINVLYFWEIRVATLYVEEHTFLIINNYNFRCWVH